jgi:hypothetical protein
VRPRLSQGGRVLIPADAHVRIARLPLHLIRVPDNYCGMDLGHLAQLAALLRSGATAPPALVWADEDEHAHWLIEGRHRYVSALAAGCGELLTVVTDKLVIAT